MKNLNENLTIVKGATLTPPIIGRIAMGHAKPRDDGSALPQKDDHFTITTLVQNSDRSWPEHPLHKQHLGEKRKLESIPVRIAYNSLRLNLTNLVQGGTVNESALAQFGRLFNQLGLPASELATLVQGLRAAQAPAESGSQAPLMPQTLGQLTWLGVSPATVAVLAPHAALLPERRQVNLNTAGVEVLLASIEGLDMAGANKIVAVREMQHFKTLEDVNALLGQVTRVSSNDHAVSSSYFEVHGRLRLDDVTVQERSMVRRLGLEVTTVWRERGAALRSNPTMARENRP